MLPISAESQPYQAFALADCNDVNSVYEYLSREYGEFPIAKSNSFSYFVDVTGIPIGTIEGSTLVWYNGSTKTMSIVFEANGQACILVSGTLTNTYK